MDLGDAAGWAAFVISGGALVVAVKAQRDGRRSANAAEESVKEARRSGDAAVRSAVAAELTLADQQRAAEEQRAMEAEAARPRPALFIQYQGGAQFHLVNRGTGRAENIAVAEEYDAIDPWPEVSLGVNEVYPFMMAGDMATHVPGAIRVTWDGLDEPVSLLVPPNSA
ncbi:hypothetical protein ACFWXI_06660 [[Kitasatospora] papulosa]|uniref:hypothetical protein n=1 Tax=[Kitasatospora] papulosa TaxID=1464011 RepID=UPI003673A6D6